MATIVGVIFVVGAYTPPSYDDITLTLDTSYTPPSYDDITLILGDQPSGNDSCSCPSLNDNWVVQMHDNCNLTACDLGTGTLSFNSTGYTTCKGEINTTDLGDPGSTGILYIDSDCKINID